MKLVRTFIAAAAALAVGVAIQLVATSSPASATTGTDLCVACWTVIER